MTWLQRHTPERLASSQLICFPHAGGAAAFYRPWAGELSPTIELLAVQYPGRASRIAEALIDDAHELAGYIADAMQPLLDRPVALFGHSMGASLAYEVARLLSDRGNPPAHLFVSAARAPHDRADIERIADKDDEHLIAHLSTLGDKSAEALREPELCELVLPYIRNDMRLVENYRPRPRHRLTVPITALAGDVDPSLAKDRIGSWSTATDGAFTARVLPGDHFYLIRQRSAVITEINRALLGGGGSAQVGGAVDVEDSAGAPCGFR